MENKQFDLYSRYYDLLYKEKNYKTEADYVHNLIQSEYSEAENILEFGSGTGRHGIILKNKGYKIYGLEKSASMVELAIETGFDCEQADITCFKLDRTFDVVLALFHVISYLNENFEIRSAFKNAAQHLKPAGLFIFDVWYLPAVLKLEPENRIKRVNDEEIEVIRFATPQIHWDRNVVDVMYNLLIKNKSTNQWHEFEEKHPMRYFTIPEISFFAEDAGFKVIRAEEYLSGNVPSINTWGVCFVLKKI